MVERLLLFRGGKSQGQFELPLSESRGDFSARRDDRLPVRKVGVPMSRLMKRIQCIHVLCLAWILTIWLFEVYIPSATIAACRWGGGLDRTSRILLVADPQIIDEHTYPGRPQWLYRISAYISDLYLRKNWVYLHRRLDPDATIFLGDLFDGGREWQDPQWNAEYQRYNRIFTKPAFKKTIMSLPGNHDIGFGNDIVPQALERFGSFFGDGSSTVEIANHTIVLLDTISMLNNKDPSIYGPPNDFLERIGKQTHDKPRILLTHVPFYRSSSQSCGKLREHGDAALPYLYGVQYQTLVNPDVAQRILETVRPIAIFSGDDHDYCEVSHSYHVQDQEVSIQEYTIKSISMAMGIYHPGVQLLTLKSEPGNDPLSTASYSTSICTLAQPYLGFFIYGMLAPISLIALYCYRSKSHDSKGIHHWTKTSDGIKHSNLLSWMFSKKLALEVAMLAAVVMSCYFWHSYAIYNFPI